MLPLAVGADEVRTEHSSRSVAYISVAPHVAGPAPRPRAHSPLEGNPMPDTVATSQPAAAPRNLVARLIGVIFSPAETFRSISAHPKWLGALAVTILLTCAGQFWFLSTEVGQQAMLDQQIRSTESLEEEPSRNSSRPGWSGCCR